MKHLRIVLKDGYEQSLEGVEAEKAWGSLKEALNNNFMWFLSETPEHKIAINTNHVQYYELSDIPSKKKAKS
jgi:hypothetical protein